MWRFLLCSQKTTALKRFKRCSSVQQMNLTVTLPVQVTWSNLTRNCIGRMYWGLMISLLYYGEALTNNKMAIKVLNEGTGIGWIQVTFWKTACFTTGEGDGGWGTNRTRSGGCGTAAAGEEQHPPRRSGHPSVPMVSLLFIAAVKLAT